MRRCLFAVLAVLLVAPAASADTWPSKPIRAIIPFGAGSATDVIPRIVFDQLSQQLGQSIVVENRGGAGGTIGAAAVAKSDPDGYTLLVHSSAHTITPSLYPNLSYDTAKDFVAVGAIGSVPNVLIISPSKGLTNIKDFVAKAKANPGTFNFASVGIGSAVHLSAERFRVSAGYEAVHVPFKGGADALTEVIAGRVDYYFCPIATALPHIKDGKLLGLAVSGIRLSRFRLHLLGRRVRAEGHAEGDRRQVQCGDDQGDGRAGREGEAGCARSGGDGAVAPAVRGAGAEGDRHLCRFHEKGWAEGELRKCHVRA
jgi:tripartite-type tricarboxylate transporter receptor subunit TctC